MQGRLARAVVLFAVVGCMSKSEPAQGRDLTVVRAELDSMWTDFNRAAQAGNADALLSFYADTGYFALAGLPTYRNSAPLLPLTVELLKTGHFLEDVIQPEVTEWAGDGRVLQYGTFRDVFQPTGKRAQATYSRFSAVIARNAAGQWKLTRLVTTQDSSVTLPAAGR